MRHNSAFTLIELILVGAILGALGGIVLLRLVGAQAEAQDIKKKSELKQYQNALEIYANNNAGLYPTGTGAVNVISLCGPGNPLGDIPCVDDRNAPDQHYRYFGDSSGNNFVLWALLEKPTTNTWFIICSNGQSGTNTAEPNSSVCPL